MVAADRYGNWQGLWQDIKHNSRLHTFLASAKGHLFGRIQHMPQPKTPAPKTAKKANAQTSINGARRLIDQRIKDLGDWRGKTLARMRALILEAVPDALEEVKWRGVPVWSHNGIMCTGETYKNVVKLTFAHGAKLDDPRGLFNASLEGNSRRAIDIHEGKTVNAAAFKSLIKAAVAFNRDKAVKSPKSKKKSVVLLSGGNPQIAKADGDAPVQAYIAAMPGWKSAVGKRLDVLIVKNAPKVRKAVKWNSPFYGIDGQGWFVTFHVLTRYVKVTFFKGKSLKPMPPGHTERSGDSRWFDIHEDGFDEKLMAKWVKQAADIPGWIP
jgi:hypothetical protein